MATQAPCATHYAILHNRAASISALFEGGADIEATNDLGWTALSSAARWDSCVPMLALLHLGANVNAQCKQRRTPLHQACHGGKADAADLLLRWSADETIPDGHGETPSQLIPDIAYADDGGRPNIKRLIKLLVHAPQDRARRRRGFSVMRRANLDRVRLVVDIPDNAVDAIGQQPRECPSRRAK